MYNVTIFGINLKIDPVAFTLPIGNGWTVDVIAHILSFLPDEYKAVNNC